MVLDGWFSALKGRVRVVSLKGEVTCLALSCCPKGRSYQSLILSYVDNSAIYGGEAESTTSHTKQAD